MSTDFKRLLGNIFSLGLVRGLDYLIPLITLPYLISVLGIEAYGLVEYALAFALYFGAVINYGFGVTAVRKLALVRTDGTKTSAVFNETIIAILLLVIVSGGVYSLLVSSIESFRSHAGLYLASYLHVAAQALFPTWFYRGMERIALGAALTAGSRLLYLIGIFVFVRTPGDLILVPTLNAGVMLLAAVFSVVLIIRQFNVKLSLPSIAQLRAVYASGFNAFIAQLTPTLYNNSATFLLGAFFGPAAVGVFSAAKKITEVFNSAGLIISNAIFPYLLRHRSQVRLVHNLMWGLAVTLSVVCFVSADFLTSLLFPEVNEPIAHYLKIMALGILGYFGNLIYHTNGLMLLELDAVVRRISILASISFLLIGLISIPIFGIYGGIGMIVGARLLMAVLGAYYYRRESAPKARI